MLDLLAGRDRAHAARDGTLAPPAVPAGARRRLGINATRWSLDRADHNEGSATCF